MWSHLAELNAFRISRQMTAHIRLVYRLPLMASEAIAITRSIASIVKRPFRNPNWLSDKPPASSIAASSLEPSTRSNNFPAISNIQSGRYEDGSSEGFFPLARSTNLCTFHCAGKIPSCKHALNVSTNIWGTFSAAVFMARPGIPSSPGAFRMEIFLRAIFISAFVTPGSSAAPSISIRPVPAGHSRCSGNRWRTTLSRKTGQVRTFPSALFYS